MRQSAYLADVAVKPGRDRPAAAEVVTEAMKRISGEVAK